MCIRDRYNHQYYLSYPEGGSTYNNAVLVYHYLYESWTKFKGINARMWNNFDGSQDGQVNINEIYFGDSQTGDIYQYGVGYDDDGDDITVKYITKYFNFDTPEVIKTFRRVIVDSISQGDFYLDYDIDKGTSTGTYQVKGYVDNPNYQWGNCTWGELIWHTPKSVLFGTSMDSDAYGRALRLIIRESSSEPLNIYGIVVRFRPKRRRF